MRLLLVLFTAAAARPRWHELSDEYAFEEYKADFGKSYAPQEDDERRVIFEARLKSILEHNTNPSTYKKGVNAAGNAAMAAARPTVSVNLLAHPATGGNQHYVATDRVEAPPALAPAFHERLVVMPAHYQVNSHAAEPRGRSTSRAALVATRMAQSLAFEAAVRASAASA